jgi:hypothetical protein
MIKSFLIAAAIVVTSTASSYAHCGTCDHKEKKGSCEKKDGAKDDCGDKDDKKTDEKK